MLKQTRVVTAAREIHVMDLSEIMPFMMPRSFFNAN